MATPFVPANPPIQPLGLVGETVQPVPNVETRTEEQYFQDVTTPTGLRPVSPDAATPAPADPFAGFEDAGFDQFQDAPDEFANFQTADDLDVKSVEELDADRDNFRPADYFTNNPDVAKDPKKLAKLIEVYRRRDEEGLTAKGVAASAIKNTPGLVSDIAGGIKRLGERAIDVVVQPTANIVLGTLTGDLFDDQKRASLFNETRKSIRKGVSEVGAGSEAATVGLVDLARTGLEKLPQSEVAFPGRFSPPGGATVPTPKKKTDQQLLAQLSDDASFRQNAEAAMKGEGEAAKNFGLDKETLAKEGIVLDETAIQQLSLVDPITMVATGGAFKLVGAGGKLLGAARTLEGAQQLADKLSRVAKFSAGKAVQGTGKAASFVGAKLQGAGGSAALITGVGSAMRGGSALESLAVAAATKAVGPIVRKGGGLLEHAGKAIAGEVPVSANLQKVLDYTVKPVAGAAGTVGKGALEGMAAGAPFALAAQDDETAGALLGAGSALGTAGAAGAGAFRVVKSSASRRYFGENRPVLPDVASQAYGFDAALDAKHQENIAKLSAQDASELNNFREVLRQQGGEIYAVDRSTFRDQVAEGLRANGVDVTPGMLDTYENHSAFFDTSKGDRKVVYLNSDTTGLQHDAGHIFDAVLSPEKRAELRSAVESAFTPEQRKEFRDTYERRVGNKISDTAAVDEFIAEQFAALFNNVPVTELNAPKSLLNKFIDVAAEAAESLGIDLSAGATTPNLGAPVSVGIRQLFRNAAGDVTKANIGGVPPIKVDFRGPTPPSSGGGPAPRPPVSPVAPVSPVGETTPAAPGSVASPTGQNLRAAPPEVLKFQAPTPVQTPGAREAAAARFAETGIDIARAEAKKNDGSPNSQIIERISDAMESGSPVVQIEHLGFTSKSKPKATIGNKLRRKEREAGQAKLDLTKSRAVAPADVISKHSKNFVPYKWEKRGDTLKLTAMSLDKIIENIKTLSEAASDPKIAELIPYPVENGRITDEGWRQIVADNQAYSENQANGRMGDGNKLNVPEIGLSVPAQNPSYTPKMLTPERANFQNLLQGLDTPSTGASPLEIPANAKGQIFAEENLRPTETPVNIPAKKLAKQGFENPAFAGRTVQEVNPLRNRMKEAGFDFDTLSKVTEVINARDITSAVPRPDINYKAPVTDVIRGGFLPKRYPKSELDAHIISLANGKESAFNAPTEVHFIGQYNSEGKLLGVMRDFYSSAREAEVSVQKVAVRPPPGTTFKAASMSLDQYKKMYHGGLERPIESKGVSSENAGPLPNSLNALENHLRAEVNGQETNFTPPEQVHFIQLRNPDGSPYGTVDIFYPTAEDARNDIPSIKPPEGVSAEVRSVPLSDYRAHIRQLEQVKAIKKSLAENTAAGPLTDFAAFMRLYRDNYFSGWEDHPSFKELTEKFPRSTLAQKYQEVFKKVAEQAAYDEGSISKKFKEASGDSGKELEAARYAERQWKDSLESLNSDLYRLLQSEPYPKDISKISPQRDPQTLWMSPEGEVYDIHVGDKEAFPVDFLGATDSKTIPSGWAKIEVGSSEAPKGAGHISIETSGPLADSQKTSLKTLSKATNYEIVDSSGKSVSSVVAQKASEAFLTQKSLETVDWSEIRRNLQEKDPKNVGPEFGTGGDIYQVEDIIESLILNPEKSPNSFPKQHQRALNELYKLGREQLLERGQSPGMFLPAPTEFRQKNLGGRTVEEFSDYILKATPEEWKAATDNMTGGLTGGAWNLGLGLKDAGDVGVLKSFQEKLSTATKEAMQSGNFDGAYSLVSKGQFFREAYEAATGTGSAGAAFKRGTAGMESAKPPFPIEQGGANFLPAEQLDIGTSESTPPELRVLPAAPGGRPPTEPPGSLRPPPVAAGFLPAEELEPEQTTELRVLPAAPGGRVPPTDVPAVRPPPVAAGTAQQDENKAGFLPSPDETIRDLAKSYADGAGIAYAPKGGYAEVKPDLAKRLADFYEAAKSDPSNPEVKASYDALIRETEEQGKSILAAGYKIEPWTGEGEPYKNSAAAISDVRDNKHLYFRRTTDSFGTGTEVAGNPMLAESSIVPGQSVNDVFRWVHDFFGHSKEGYQFGPRGEFNAWRSHSEMYSPEAQGALASETLAQNSWVNFGRHLEGKNIPQAERPFAEQKNIVVPEELIAEAGFLPRTESGRKLEEQGFKVVPSGELGVRRVAVTKDGQEVAAIQSVQRAPKTAEIAMVQKYAEAPRGVGEVLYREVGAQLKADGVTEVTGNVVSPEPLVIRRKVFGDFASLDLNGEPATIEQALATAERIQNRTENEVAAIEPVNTISDATRFLPSTEERAVASAAVQDADGKIFLGSYHGTAIENAQIGKAKKIEGYSDPSWDVPYKVGFVTNAGEFLTRDQAFKRGQEFNQLPPDAEPFDVDGVHTRDFKNAGGFLPKVKRDAQGRPLNKSGEIDYPRWAAEGAAARRKQESEPIETPKPQGRISKEEAKTPTGWILPDKTFVPLDTAYHEQFLAENSKDLNKKFGTALSETPSVGDRLDALNAGFVRFRYDPRSGNLLIEANAGRWPKIKPTVKRRLQDYEDRITGFTLSILNNKALQVDSVTVPRMQELSGPQKLDAIDDAVDSLRVPAQ